MPYKQNDILYYVLQYTTYSLKIFFHGYYTELASTMFSYALQKDTYCKEGGKETEFGGLSLTLE